MLHFAFTPQDVSNATEQFSVPPARECFVVALWQSRGNDGFEQRWQLPATVHQS
jgi:hypothetical protein